MVSIFPISGSMDLDKYLNSELAKLAAGPPVSAQINFEGPPTTVTAANLPESQDDSVYVNLDNVQVESQVTLNDISSRLLNFSDNLGLVS
jgi:hypothetical protein